MLGVANRGPTRAPRRLKPSEALNYNEYTPEESAKIGSMDDVENSPSQVTKLNTCLFLDGKQTCNLHRGGYIIFS